MISPFRGSSIAFHHLGYGRGISLLLRWNSQEGAGQWRCEKCNRSYDSFKHRLMMSVSFTDASGQVWVTAFQDVAEKMIGSTSQDLGELRDSNEAAFDEKISAATFQSFLLKCRAKSDTWNEETRVRVTAVACDQINFVDESRHLVSRQMVNQRPFYRPASIETRLFAP